jgi:hypothetical protein
VLWLATNAGKDAANPCLIIHKLKFYRRLKKGLLKNVTEAKRDWKGTSVRIFLIPQR